VQTDFYPTVIMSSYLIGIFVTDFECKTEESKAGLSDSMDVRTCSRPSQLDKLGYSLKSTVLIVEYLQMLFGVAYPLPKLGNI
jgi:aminopeptidase N